MGCTACSKEKVFARGLCQACYYRLRRNGTVERKNMARAAHCTHPGCERPVLGRNLCSLHYGRSQHPVSNSWKALRSRNPGNYPPEWDRFDAFLADVGERPSDKHQLRRIDTHQPYSKENVRWRGPTGPSFAADKNVYQREWSLQERFGITGQQYDEMLREQGGVCAICQQPERAADRRNGQLKALAVDHDHLTGANRGLLCRNCNIGLGLFEDSPEFLRSAIAYLEAHAAKPSPPA